MWCECLSGCLQYVVAFLVIVLTSKYAINRVKHSGKAKELREKAKKKRDSEQKYIQEQIDDLSKELNNVDVESILKHNGPALLEEIRSKRLNPVVVLKAYVYNACKVTKKLNCVTEVVKDCQKTVEKLPWDQLQKLPLFGIPVSLKETFETEAGQRKLTGTGGGSRTGGYKGAPSTMGWAKFLDNIPTEDSVLAKVLKQCGAVPFVKTNISHMTLSFECSNPLYGEVSNPHNTDFSAGGSSSGEGAIVGAGASVLGFGSDTGGSVRCPSHINGIVGLKPSMGRLSLKGFVPPYAMTIVTTSPGPMARDVDTVVMAMRAVCSDLTFQLDPHVVPIPFRDEMYNNSDKLRIGYYDDNGFIKPIPACQRAVRMTKEALEGAGHTLIPFTVPDVEYIMDVITKALFADGGRTCIDILEDDLVDKYLQATYDAWVMPWWKKKLKAAFEIKCKRDADSLLAIGVGGDPSAYTLWQMRSKLEKYKEKFWKLWKEKHNIDAMICPAYPIVASPKGKLAATGSLMSYTILYNAINYAAGIVPITKVTQKDIDDLENYEGHFKDDWDEYIKTASVKSINMPVGVQCVAPPYNEETCLRLMKEVETLLPMKRD